MDAELYSSSRARYLLTGSALVAAVASAGLCGAGDYRAGLSCGVAAFGVAATLIARPAIETVLLTWFLTTPLLSFFIHLPSDDPVITYDRVSLGLVVILMAVQRIANRWPDPTAAKFESVWALLCAIALASVATRSNHLGYSLRIAVDSFCLPLIAFHASRRYFASQGRGHILLGGAAAVAFFLFATGAYELLLRTDLFPFEGSQLVRESEIRVNGPFQSDSSYAVICLMLAVFLRAAPRALAVRLDQGARIIQWSAVACAAVASLFPLYRIAGVALLVSWIALEITISKKREWNFLKSRRALAAAAVALVTLAGGALLFEVSSQGRLSSARNIYGRLATWEAGVGIVMDRPLFGAGLTNYNDYFNLRYSRADQWQGSVENARPVGYPHSNGLWIAAELGLPAFVVYVIANVYLFLIGYRGLKKATTTRQRTAAGCWVALLAAYWIPGLTLTSGAYSDLNLYFFFLLGLLSTRMLVSRSEPAGWEAFRQ
jgi:O-antigen ligase